MLISQEAIDLIVSEEVSSRKTYEARYQRPEWPGGASGVTIGIGYDVGAGVKNKEQLWADWRGVIPDTMIRALEPCIGVTGDRARDLLSSVRGSVSVPWDAAMHVFENIDIPRWYAICKRALPNFELLSPDCKGALLSLAYNRGASFNQAGDRYSEMRAIRQHMAAMEFSRIPAEFRSMKRLWVGKGLPGLLARRDREADLFQRGIGKPTVSVPAKPHIPVQGPVILTTSGGIIATVAHEYGFSAQTVISILVFAACAAIAYFVIKRIRSRNRA